MTIVSNDTSISIEVINPRVIKITPINKESEVLIDDKIVSLNFKELQVNIGESIKIKKQQYKIKSIIKEELKGIKGPGYYLYTHDRITKSTVFIMPLLGNDKVYFKTHKNFVNCFIGSELYNDYGEYLYLLYRYDGSKEFYDFDQSLCNHPFYEETKEVDVFHTLYKFKIPDYYKEDVLLLIDGKYSKISSKYKQRILDFNRTTVDKEIGKILTKSPIRRQQMEYELESKLPKNAELLDIFNKEQEIYKLEYIIEK